MEENLGTVSVAPEVLIQLVRLTTLATPGVARLSSENPSGVHRLFNGKAGEGILLQVQDNVVSMDVYIVAEPEAQLLHLGQTLQQEISHGIQDIVGMPVREINIHIDDVADHVASASE
jgi:uncharacterized alkaline shock family protein YloU